MDEKRKYFLEMEPTPGGDAMDIAEMTAKDLGYSINLVEKAAAVNRVDSSFEGSSTVDEMLSNSIICHREIFCKRNKLHCFKKLTRHPTFSNSHAGQSAVVNTKARSPPAKTL